MIDLNLIDSSIAKSYRRNDPFYHVLLENIEEFSKNEWELHKKLVCEGVNQYNIAKTIQRDYVEKLQEISL